VDDDTTDGLGDELQRRGVIDHGAPDVSWSTTATAADRCGAFVPTAT
jgi:hypothetical protein